MLGSQKNYSNKRLVSVYTSLANVKTILCLLLGLAGASASRAETLSVASLRRDEVIDITFESSGCFNQSTDHYRITRDSAGRTWFEASTEVREWHKQQKKMLDRGTASIGKVALTAAEVAGLDSLFRFYRQKHPGGCTLVETAAVRYLRDGTSIGTEEFRDASCMTPRIDLCLKDESYRHQLGEGYDWELMKQIVPFSKIKNRIDPSKEQ